MHITTDAIVLREQPAGDFDSVLTLLTRECGVITAYSKGSRKPRSTMRAGTQLLSFSSVVLFSGRGGYIVDKADLIRLFMGVRGDVENLSLCSYFSQIAIEAAPRQEHADAFLRLLLNSLHLLDSAERTRDFLKPVFELRAMVLAGFQPDIVSCRECGRYECASMLFFPLDGQLLCQECAKTEQWYQWVEQNAAAGGAIPVSCGVLAAMRHICYAAPEKLFSFTLSGQSTAHLSAITETYVVTCLEKRLAALDFYKSIALT